MSTNKEKLIEEILGYYQQGWEELDTKELQEQMRDLELDHLKISPKDAKQLKRKDLLKRLKEQDIYNLSIKNANELQEELRFQKMPI